MFNCTEGLSVRFKIGGQPAGNISPSPWIEEVIYAGYLAVVSFDNQPEAHMTIRLIHVGTSSLVYVVRTHEKTTVIIRGHNSLHVAREAEVREIGFLVHF